MQSESQTHDLSSGTLLDLDTVSNLSFDDLEEAPGFVEPPDGIYTLLLETARIEKYKTRETPNRKAGENSRISHYYTIKEIHELVNANEQKPPIDSKFSERFMLNEQGLKYWKTKAKQILGDSIAGANLTVANVLKELGTGTYQFKARVSQKKSEGKGDNKGRMFTNIQVRVLAAEPQAELDDVDAIVTTDEKVI